MCSVCIILLFITIKFQVLLRNLAEIENYSAINNPLRTLLNLRLKSQLLIS